MEPPLPKEPSKPRPTAATEVINNRKLRAPLVEEENGAGRLEDDLAISYKANTFFPRYPVITRPDIYPKELET